jgi:hypothetical protein
VAGRLHAYQLTADVVQRGGKAVVLVALNIKTYNFTEEKNRKAS